MGAGFSVRGSEIPLPLSFLYLFRYEGVAQEIESFGTKRTCTSTLRKTVSGGEFGWGGTSVKQ